MQRLNKAMQATSKLSESAKKVSAAPDTDPNAETVALLKRVRRSAAGHPG